MGRMTTAVGLSKWVRVAPADGFVVSDEWAVTGTSG